MGNAMGKGNNRRNRTLNNKAQGILEMTFALIIMVLFLGGIINIWLWANKQLVKRQVEYNSSRVIAGTSSDAYRLQWPMQRPEELGEERVLLDAPIIVGPGPEPRGD